MADAVVHRRPRGDRHRNRKHRGEHHGQKCGAAPDAGGLWIPARGGYTAPHSPQNPSASISSGSVSATSVGT